MCGIQRRVQKFVAGKKKKREISCLTNELSEFSNKQIKSNEYTKSIVFTGNFAKATNEK